MILEIRLSNFFSIKDEVVLDMRAANINSKNAKALENNLTEFDGTKVLKIAAIYGANASGKSNIIKAIRFCSGMIAYSHNHNENTTFSFTKFKFGNSTNKPSNYFVRFVDNQIEYEYSFSLMQNGFVTESLFYYPNGRRKKIFTRDERLGNTKKEKYSFGGGIIKRPLDVAESTSDKTLYISRASQMDRDIAKSIFNYFYNSIFILGYHNFNLSNVESIFNNYKELLLKALQIADSDIVEIKIKKIKKQVPEITHDPSAESIKIGHIEEEGLEIKTYHRANPKVAFNLFAEESKGTIKLFYIMLSILHVIKNNRILLIDEIEESLHTDIVAYIFNLFKAGEKAQLICATHNTNLLDLSKLRKDQIYFVNKKEDASTDLYSLYDYKDFRDTMNLEKAYLQGRFDAVPYIDDSVENLKSLLNE